MIRTLRAPSNPDMLGRLIAALRVHAGQRPPKNEKERAIDALIKAQGVSPDVAKRMVGTLDAMPRSSRTRLLGAMSAREFVPPEAVAAPAFAPVNTTVAASTFTRTHETHGPLAEALSRNPDVTPLPLYTVRYQGLYCQKESSWDQGSSSDEIYSITSAVHIDAGGKNLVRTERHPAAQDARWYENVDAGEERIGPVAASWQGNSDPVSMTVVVFERDQGDPNAYREEVDALVKALIGLATYLYPPAAVLAAFSGSITDAFNWCLGTGDDIISTETVVNPRALLEMHSGRRPDFYIGQKLQADPNNVFLPTNVPVSTNLMYHFLTTHTGGGATYVVGFDVVRDPPLPLPDPIIT